MASSRLFINAVTMLVLFSTFACKIHGAELKNIMKCMESLTPCQPFLKSPRLPTACCDPLKKLLTGDPTCVCSVYNNDSILKSFNMTKSQAYQLPIRCGMPPPDLNRCKAFNGTGASRIVVQVKDKNNEGNVLVFNVMGFAVMLCSTFLLLL